MTRELPDDLHDNTFYDTEFTKSEERRLKKIAECGHVSVYIVVRCAKCTHVLKSKTYTRTKKTI